MRLIFLCLLLLLSGGQAVYSQSSEHTANSLILNKYKSVDDIPEDKLQEYYYVVKREQELSEMALQMKHLQDMSIEELEAYNNQIEELYKALGDKTREQRVASEGMSINAAPGITKYPAKVRTSLIRMIIGGKQVEDIRFDSPVSKEIKNNPKNQVFSHRGGGAPYAMPEKGINDGTPWKYSKGNNLENTGTDNADVIAFLTNIDRDVCLQTNEELLIGTKEKPVPEYGATPDFTHTVQIAKNPVTLKVAGQPFGCFQGNDGVLYYHHVLIER